MEQTEMMERYELAMERIRAIKEETSVSAPFSAYFREMTDFIGEIEELVEDLGSGKWEEASLSELSKLNQRLYRDVTEACYGDSYANPAVAVRRLGEEYGQVLSFLYTEIRGMIVWAYEKRLWDITVTLELFIQVYNAFEEEKPEASRVRQMIYWHMSDYCDVMIPRRIREQLDPGLSFAGDLICGADLADVRYLYRFGEYITENEIEVSRFLAKMPEEQIEAIASTFTEGYRRGFENAGIDLRKKKTVNIRYSLGFERIVRAAAGQFEKMGLKSIIYREARHSINRRPQGNPGFGSTPPCRQFAFDHREDAALYLDKKLVERKLSVLRQAYEDCRELAFVHAGPAVMEIFGEHPFFPANCPEALHFTKQQQEWSVYYDSQAGQLVNEYSPGDERSVTIIAYPIPEIGRNFAEIFARTVEINTLDYHLYERIQQTIIDALDEGEAVEIKGAEGNRTDLTVQLWKLENQETETLFENCLADVNIPVGEVFTTPRLAGTNGILHVSQVYLNGLKYVDLELRFADGMIADCRCANFGTEEENRAYLRNNVLFNHETLPMGEFAVGTNTAAYVMARKYGIESRLPILIAEKTGPHFAVGDTCFSRSEEIDTFNPDGKRMIAKDNECSRLRKEDVSRAYFNCHTDITIPYNELDRIRVRRADGSFCPIVEKGRFVLPGTEPLNEPLDRFAVDKGSESR